MDFNQWHYRLPFPTKEIVINGCIVEEYLIPEVEKQAVFNPHFLDLNPTLKESFLGEPGITECRSRRFRTVRWKEGLPFGVFLPSGLLPASEFLSRSS